MITQEPKATAVAIRTDGAAAIDPVVLTPQIQAGKIYSAAKLYFRGAIRKDDYEPLKRKHARYRIVPIQAMLGGTGTGLSEKLQAAKAMAQQWASDRQCYRYIWPCCKAGRVDDAKAYARKITCPTLRDCAETTITRFEKKN